ncbi:hypothetical protein LX64_00086 [Chitinophaga skermanii]|uniref:Uncharacterized protein n=1 Tax=Chitinophaga skermanii TaxID=331697 RepID=A0A327R3Y1_9BACT|nr:HAD domain-containing protein [Chitinophaga skermanii]RAJ10484.1 hypothetical protein LX64_00086 [Chitinophaga skermanii]
MQLFILLDIDGVMVPAVPWKPLKFLQDGFYDFEPNAQQHLTWLLQKTGANIILTTSHRNRFTKNEWDNIFTTRIPSYTSALSIDEYFVLNNISIDPFANRLQYIKTWCKHAHQHHFVILDDDASLENLLPSMKQYWIRTSPSIGFNQSAAEKAVEILQKEQ